MTGNRRKPIRRGLIVASAILFAICVAASRVAQGQAGSSTNTNTPSPKKTEEQFKNIQTLKGIPADRLIPAMQFIAASLGVECEFCHVEGAFEKDDKKPKLAARKMIEMMFAINKENFEGHREVTCYSCHRGSTDPVGTPLVMGDEPKSVSETKKPEDKREGVEGKDACGPTADQLLDKYLQAVGGAAAIEKI